MTSPSSNSQILLLSGVRGDTRRYRSLHLAEQCRLLHLEPVVAHVMQAGLLRMLKTTRFEVAFLQRVEMDRCLARIIKLLQDQKALILYDTDDLIFDPAAIQYIDSPDFSDPIRRKLYADRVQRQRAALLACQGAAASTDYLAEQIAKLGLPVAVHRNAFSHEMAQIAEKARQTKKQPAATCVIGYASGTRTHDRDFALVAPTLQNILRKFPQTRLHLIGPLDPGEGWADLANRIQRTPLVPWRQLPFHLAAFDINLAPLIEDNPFAQSKSAIKFMEAALVDVPTMASPTNAFCQAIQSGRNGFLAQSSADWETGLTEWIQNPASRQQIGLRAGQDVRLRDNPITRAKQLAETLNKLNQTVFGENRFEAPMPLKKDQKILTPGAEVESQPTNRQLGLYTLRWRGPLPLLGGLWVWLRRLLSPIFPFKRS